MRDLLARRRRLRSFAPLAPLVFSLSSGGLAVLAALAGCSSGSDLDATKTTRPGAGDAGDPASRTGDGSSVPSGSDPEALFRALEKDLVASCGGTGGACHVSGTLGSAGKWLAPPDVYVSAKSWRGVIPGDNFLEHSILLTQIEHTGPALVNSPSLYGRVREWIAAEIKGAKLPGSDPFAVSEGLNVVELGKVAPGMDGARLRFTAATANKILTLTEMKLVGPTANALHVETPFFVILPASGPVVADPTNGFGGTLDVSPNETKAFFGGALVLAAWNPANKLQIVFTKVSTVAIADSGAGGCKSVATFTSSAVPAFKLDLGAGATCLGCHAGGNDIAKQALDLSQVGTDDAYACAQALNFVNRADKPKSQIIATATGAEGGNPNHAVKNAPASFTQGMLGWVNNE